MFNINDEINWNEGLILQIKNNSPRNEAPRTGVICQNYNRAKNWYGGPIRGPDDPLSRVCSFWSFFLKTPSLKWKILVQSSSRGLLRQKPARVLIYSLPSGASWKNQVLSLKATLMKSVDFGRLIVKLSTWTKKLVKYIYSGINRFLKNFNTTIRSAHSAHEMKAVQNMEAWFSGCSKG